jgi:hypothetical protein
MEGVQTISLLNLLFSREYQADMALQDIVKKGR